MGLPVPATDFGALGLDHRLAGLGLPSTHTHASPAETQNHKSVNWGPGGLKVQIIIAHLRIGCS